MSNEQFITDTIEQARIALGLDEQWKFTWKPLPEGKYESEIEPDEFTEKRAVILLDPEQGDLARLRRDIYHEVGHAVVYPIWRNASDWADHMVKGKKMRAIWDEMVNSSENVVIDHIVCQVLKI